MSIINNVKIFMSSVSKNLNDLATPDAVAEINYRFENAKEQISSYSAQIKRQAVLCASILDQKKALEQQILIRTSVMEKAAAEKNEDLGIKAILERNQYQELLNDKTKEFEQEDEILTRMKNDLLQLKNDLRDAEKIKNSYLSRLSHAKAEGTVLNLKNELNNNISNSSIDNLKEKVFKAEADTDLKRENCEGKTNEIETAYQDYLKEASLDAAKAEFSALINQQ